jgi:hypothetical protein
MTMKPKKEVADELIRWHFEVEPDLSMVFRIVSDNEDSLDEPIKLLEVNAATIATGSVEPFSFAPSKSVPYRTVIAEITPDELARVQSNEIKLPAGWSIDNVVPQKRPKVA